MHTTLCANALVFEVSGSLCVFVALELLRVFYDVVQQTNYYYYIRVQRWAMIFFVFLPVSCPTFDLHLSVCAEDFDPSFSPFFPI